MFKRLFANKIVWSIIIGATIVVLRTEGLVELIAENPVQSLFVIVPIITGLIMDGSTPGISDKTKIIAKSVEDIVDIIEELTEVLLEEEELYEEEVIEVELDLTKGE